MESGCRRFGWETFLEYGQNLYLSGAVTPAETLAKAALKVLTQESPEPSLTSARLFFLLADIFSTQKNYAAAETFYGYALADYQALPGNNVIDTAIILKRLSEICRLRNKVRQASNFNLRSQNLLSETRRVLEETVRRS